MAIYDYLPKYHVVEPNNLKGLQPGFVVSQLEVKDGCKLVKEDPVSEAKMLENGHLMTITGEGLDIWAADAPMFLHYTEPLNTLLNSDKYFAVNLDNENPRLVQLIPGDEWMSDIDYETDLLYTTLWTEINKHVKKVDSSSALSKDDWFAVDKLADGTKAFHYIYIG